MVSVVRMLVLGAVRRRGRAHGYLIRADLEAWGAHEWATATSGSVYYALTSLSKRGLLSSSGVAPSDAGGPPRTEYEITSAGEEAYFGMLRAALSHHDARLDTLSAAVGFIEDLPRAETIALLRQRAAGVQRWRTSVTSALPAETDVRTWGPIGAVIELWLHTADTREIWTQQLLHRLESGEFHTADEPT